MCVYCKRIYGRFQSASLSNFLPSGLSISLELAAGAFVEGIFLFLWSHIKLLIKVKENFDLLYNNTIKTISNQ